MDKLLKGARPSDLPIEQPAMNQIDGSRTDRALAMPAANPPIHRAEVLVAVRCSTHQPRHGKPPGLKVRVAHDRGLSRLNWLSRPA